MEQFTKEEIINLADKVNSGMASQDELRLYQRVINSFLPQSSQWNDVEHGDRREADLQIRKAIYEKTNIRISRGGKTSLLWYAAAAACTLFFVAIYLWKYQATSALAENNPRLSPKQSTEILPGGNKAILTLSNGTVVPLDDSRKDTVIQEGAVNVAQMNNSKLVYHTPSHNKGPVLYNTVSTPRGGQYQVVLPDGTLVWLNAASSIKFPTVFPGSKREVEVKGEVYFEVAENSKAPFVVTTAENRVEVLGTHFNVNAYMDEPAKKITLVEGLVKVSDKNKSVLVSAGNQASSDASGIRVQSADVELELAWKNGFISFKSADIRTIMRTVEKWYDVEIIYKADLPQRTFSGEISRNSNLSQLLRILEASNIHFSIEGKKIIVSS